MAGNGTIILDAGPFPGVGDSEFTITGLTGIADASKVEAWIQPADTTAGFSCDGCTFNGIAYLTKATVLTSAADSGLGMLSAWVLSRDLLTGGSQANILTGGASGLADEFQVYRSQGITNFPWYNILGQSGALNNVVVLGGNYITPTWVHILASWDAGNNLGTFWLDDVLYDSAIDKVDSSIAYTGLDSWAVGNAAVALINPIAGALAELYFAPGQYLDFTVAANRRKFNQFVGGQLLPVNLGTTGSTPTGTAPKIYLHLDNSESAQNFKLNRGTGGDFVWNGDIANVPSFGIPLVQQPAHSLEEHVFDAPVVKAYSPSAAGASMKVRLSARDPSYKGDRPMVWGKWNVGYGWA